MFGVVAHFSITNTANQILSKWNQNVRQCTPVTN